jgi:hypothetical protein
MPAFAKIDKSKVGIETDDEASLLKISCQPYSRSGPKPQFASNLVAVPEDLADADRIVPRCDVSRKSLLFDLFAGNYRGRSLLRKI